MKVPVHKCFGDLINLHSVSDFGILDTLSRSGGTIRERYRVPLFAMPDQRGEFFSRSSKHLEIYNFVDCSIVKRFVFPFQWHPENGIPKIRKDHKAKFKIFCKDFGNIDSGFFHPFPICTKGREASRSGGASMTI